MSQNGDHDVYLLESLLEEGLFLFGADKIESAIAVWRKALELAPGDARVIDYLQSAGADLPPGLAMGTHPGRERAPLAIHRKADATIPVEIQRSIVPPQPFAGFGPATRTLASASGQHHAVTPPPPEQRPSTAVPTPPQSVQQPIAAQPSAAQSSSQLLPPLLTPSRQTAPSIGYVAMPRRRWPIALAAVGLGAVLLGGVLALASLSKSDSPQAANTSGVTPSDTANLAPTGTANVAPTAPVTAPATEKFVASPEPTGRHFRVEVQVIPAGATLRIDDELVATGQLAARFSLDGKPHTLRVEADGYSPVEVTFVDTAPAKQIVLTALDEVTDVKRKRKRPRARARNAKSKKQTEPAKAAAKPAPAPAPVRKRPPTDNLNPWAKK